MHQNGRVFSTTGAHGDSFPGLKHFACDDCMMDFFFKNQEKAFLTNWHSILGSFDPRVSFLAKLTLHFIF
jgi:hypothetical protein